MKRKLKLFLLKKKWYYRLKYSFLFRIYQYIFKPGVIKEERRELAFYRSFLSSGDLIFDIGAYDGHKTAAFLHLSRRVVACEPDKENLAILHTRFRHQEKRVIIEDKALGVQSGEASFFIHQPGSAFNTLNPRWKETLEKDQLNKWNESILFSGEIKKVSMVSIDQLIARYGLPYFIKIDTEGSEAAVLAGLTKKIPFLSFECLLPDFLPELRECFKHLLTIDKNAQFAIAINEQITAAGFMSFEEVEQWIASTSIHHFEVIVKTTVN